MSPLISISHDESEKYLKIWHQRTDNSYLTLGKQGEYLGFLSMDQAKLHDGTHQIIKQPKQTMLLSETL